MFRSLEMQLLNVKVCQSSLLYREIDSQEVIRN